MTAGSIRSSSLQVLKELIKSCWIWSICRGWGRTQPGLNQSLTFWRESGHFWLTNVSIPALWLVHTLCWFWNHWPKFKKSYWSEIPMLLWCLWVWFSLSILKPSVSSYLFTGWLGIQIHTRLRVGLGLLGLLTLLLIRKASLVQMNMFKIKLVVGLGLVQSSKSGIRPDASVSIVHKVIPIKIIHWLNPSLFSKPLKLNHQRFMSVTVSPWRLNAL